MKVSVSAYRGAQASSHKKLFNTRSIFQSNAPSKYTSARATTSFSPLPLQVDDSQMMVDKTNVGPGGGSDPPVKNDSTNSVSCDSQPPLSQSDSQFTTTTTKTSKSDDHRTLEKNQRTRSNQRWMKLRTTVQLSGAISSTIQKPKPQLKREDSFLKRFSTRQINENQETLDTGDDGDYGSCSEESETLRELRRRKRRHRKKQPLTVVNPDENFYFYWLFLVSVSVLYNLWTLIVRQSFPEFQEMAATFWFSCDSITDLVFILDIVVQFRTGYLEQGLMVYDSKKLARHYVKSRPFILDLVALVPLQLLQIQIGPNPMLRFPRFIKIYRVYDYYYMVESRTVYPNLWRVVNLIHILLILAHWFGCFYFLLSQAEGFKGDWVYPYRPGEYATFSRKYLGSLYWSTLTLTTIGDLPTPETNAEFIFTIVSYLIGVFIFATIVGQVGNVITNRNANRLEFERLLDGAKTYMRHHKVPSGMKRRVLRWYDYSWSRGRIQGGGDINTALGLLPDKLKTELALHVNLSVLKKVTIFQECQPEFLHDLVLKMKAFIFTPGDLICRKGEVAREMFIIADGILEVMSETGYVITTMMAGDFFGEIGILNLDGLNKRTADVRSVGYSELFSLSRDDVLTAMKDYPEAQEILQALGRKRLQEARNVSKAINEQRKQAELNAMIVNATQAAEHRSKNKIVGRIYSDVRGLKSVLRKSRRGTKSEDSLELQPLTSISGKTESQIVNNKGMLCRMPKVLSEDNCIDNESTQTSERRISAGFPLLNKLKTLTDKHQQQHHHQSQIASTEIGESFDSQKCEEEKEIGNSSLPLIQRILLLKKKEDTEKASNVIPSTVRTQQSAYTSNTVKKSKVNKKEVVFAEDVIPKYQEEEKSKHEKHEFMKPWCLLRKATINQSSRNTSYPNSFKYEQFRCTVDDEKTNDETVSSSRMSKNNVNTHRCLTRLYGSGIKTAQSTSAQNNKINNDSALINFRICDKNRMDAKSNINSNDNDNDSDNDNNNNNNNSNNSSSSNHSKSSSSEITSSNSKYRDVSCTINWMPVIASLNEKKPTQLSRLALAPPNARCVPRHGKNYHSVDDLWPKCSGLPFVKNLKIINDYKKLNELNDNTFVRSYSLDSNKGPICGHRKNNFFTNLTRSLSEATAMGMMFGSRNWYHDNPENSYSLSTTFHEPELTSPESCETLERRKLKKILKKISSGTCKISDILNYTPRDNENIVLSDVELIRRLMNAQTVEGYVARHSTFEKSITCSNTLRSPPSAARNLHSIDSSAVSLDEMPPLPIPISINSTESAQITDVNERKYLDKDTSYSPSRNPDLIPIVDVMEEDSQQLPAFVSKHFPFDMSGDNTNNIDRFTHSCNRNTLEGIQNVYKSQVKEIEQEVRKRDMLIEVLQRRLQELEKHHECCFNDESVSDNTDYDIPEQGFLRGDSVDTVLLSPPRTTFKNQEYQDHIDQNVRLQPKIMLENRRSWEDQSEKENLELRELPSSITPRSIWKEDVSIDIATDDISTSASETDELFVQLDDNLLPHDQDWEVRMLAHELEKREHKESQCNRLRGDSIQKTQLLNVRSLEERCTFNVPIPSHRSISSDNIYHSPLVTYYNTQPVFSHSTVSATRTTSVSPDVVPIPAVTTSGNYQHSPSGS